MPRLTISAPMPLGPPSLWADSDSRSMGMVSRSIGNQPAACAASTCNSTPRARKAAASAGMSVQVPSSLFTHIRLTRRVAGVNAASTASMLIVPRASGLSRLTL